MLNDVVPLRTLKRKTFDVQPALVIEIRILAPLRSLALFPLFLKRRDTFALPFLIRTRLDLNGQPLPLQVSLSAEAGVIRERLSVETVMPPRGNRTL